MRHAASIPDVAITTDIITGFPGETEAEFSESIEFIRELNFANGHVFTFSARPGTAAMNLPDKVPSGHCQAAKCQDAPGVQGRARPNTRRFTWIRNLNVLWEKVTPIEEGQWQLSGLSDNYLRVNTVHSSPCYNQIMTVHINRLEQGGLAGEITSEFFSD